MWEELRLAFISDCTETYELTNEQAEKEWDDKGETFVSAMIDEMWDTWGNNFPKVTGE